MCSRLKLGAALVLLLSATILNDADASTRRLVNGAQQAVSNPGGSLIEVLTGDITEGPNGQPTCTSNESHTQCFCDMGTSLGGQDTNCSFNCACAGGYGVPYSPPDCGEGNPADCHPDKPFLNEELLWQLVH